MKVININSIVIAFNAMTIFVCICVTAFVGKTFHRQAQISEKLARGFLEQQQLTYRVARLERQFVEKLEA